MIGKLVTLAERWVSAYEKYVEATIRRAEHLTSIEVREERRGRERQIVSLPYGCMMAVDPEVANRPMLAFGPNKDEIKKLLGELDKSLEVK